MGVPDRIPLVVVGALCTVAFWATGFRWGRQDMDAAAPPAAQQGQVAAAVAESGGADLPEAVEEDFPEAAEEDSPGDSPEEAAAVPEEAGPHYEMGTVVPAYFDDALFIGDSRTVGLSEYCQDLAERATFYAKVSLTVRTALDKPFVKTEEGKQTIDALLEERSFSKIYIMLGINEMGGGTSESFAEDYGRMLERIREKQPESLIFIQAIMHVGREKNDSDRYFNNANINERNAAIGQLADEDRGIYYIDLNEVVDDEEGNLAAGLSYDDVHLKASAYQLWYDFLLNHGVYLAGDEAPEAEEEIG